MATTFKSIGPSGDYVSMNAAQAGLSGFGTITGPWVFVVDNIIVNEASSTTWSTPSGASSTNTITIRPDFVGSGATGSSNTDCSFAGNNNYNSVALDFNGTTGKGAGFSDNGNGIIITYGCDFFIVQDLQFRMFGDSSTRGGGAVNTCIFRRNIVRLSRNDEAFLFQGRGWLVANNLIFSTGTGANSVNTMPVFLQNQTANELYFICNTVVCAFTGTQSASAVKGDDSGTGGHYHFYGNAIYVHDLTNGGPFQDNTSAPTVEDYNIQNGTGAGLANLRTLPGAHSSTSGNIANDFVDPDTTALTDAVDFRPKAGSLLLAFIPDGSQYNPAATIATDAYKLDIRGQTRVGVANDCGCFQTAPATATLFGQAIM
jgi:hypothetical protein